MRVGRKEPETGLKTLARQPGRGGPQYKGVGSLHIDRLHFIPMIKTEIVVLYHNSCNARLSDVLVVTCTTCLK